VKLIFKGKSRSCGCINREIIVRVRTKYRGKEKRIANIFNKMKELCFNQSCKFYYRYGGRGITICDDWLADPLSFVKWSVANGYDDDLTIERIDNEGNYEPNNCKWATPAEQAKNTSTNRWIICNGKRLIMNDWARLIGVPEETIYSRLRRGWSMREALGFEKRFRKPKP
jgi:hypothetical protein